MPDLVDEIDHILCKAEDAEKAAAQFERMGFVTTPISLIKNMGVGNRLLIFPQRREGCLNFFEFMAITNPDAVHPVMGELLSSPDGIRSAVLSGPDAYAAQEHFNSLGFEFGPPAEVERDWKLPSGEIVKPAFSVLLPTVRDLRFNYCHYRNIAPYTRSEWLRHANGIDFMSALIAVADEPAAAVDPFTGIFSARPQTSVEGLIVIAPGEVELRIGTSEVLERSLGIPIEEGNRYVGIELQTRDLGLTRAKLEEGGIKPVEAPNGITVKPDDAAGISLSIVQRT